MSGKTPVDFDTLQVLLDQLSDIMTRLDNLERPTGTSRVGLVAQVQAAVANIGAAVTAYLSSGFTTGSMTATGNITVNGYLFTPAGYAYDITYTRRAAWLGNDGRLGWASSSITAKELLDTIPEPDALKIFEITSHHYERKVELAKRDDPKSEGYVGPDYHVAVEWGTIAEELHELGFWQVVIYEWDVEYELRDVLNDDGEPIVNSQGYHLKEHVGEPRRIGTEPRPIGVHYELLGLLAIIAARFNRKEHLALADRVLAIEKRQGR